MRVVPVCHARVYLLIDARHGLKDTDAGVLATLDQAAVNYQLVLTKSDEVKEADRALLIASLMPAIAEHPAAFPQPVVTSARTGAGLPELRSAIALLLAKRASSAGRRPLPRGLEPR